MTLKEYAKHINDILKHNQELADMPVIYSRDDEGNGYSQIYYEPYYGNYDGYDFEPYNEEEQKIINAVLIN